jgi:hypothetical protein
MAMFDISHDRVEVMSYAIALSENGKYIVCRMAGPMTVEIARESAKELDRLSRSTGIKRFLNDVRNAPNVSDVLANYDFAYRDMNGLNLQRDVRSAILADPADRTHDFFETVAKNAGFNVRIFHDENAAIAWLNEETSR